MSKTIEEIKSHFPQEQVRGLQIIQLAMMMGLVMFAFVIVFLTLQNKDGAGNPTPESALQQTNLLALVVAVAAMGSYAGAIIVGKAILASRMSAVFSNPKPEQAFLEAFRGVRILQLGLLEGPALLGLVICFLQTQNGVLEKHPVYWSLCIPAGIAAVIFLLTLPTADRLATSFRHQQETAALK